MKKRIAALGADSFPAAVRGACRRGNADESGRTEADVMRLPAPSSFFAYGANMLSEVVLDLNELK